MEMSDRISNRSSLPIHRLITLNDHQQINGEKVENDDQEQIKLASNPGM